MAYPRRSYYNIEEDKATYFLFLPSFQGFVQYLLDQNLPILQKQHIIHPHFTLVAEIADHIPVQGRLIDAASLRITITERQVYRTTHLLIEKCIPDAPVHARIISKGELTEVTCACV